MKKLIPILVFLAIVGFVSQAEALTEDTCGMSVTVAVGVSLEVTDKPLAFGGVNAGESGVSTGGCTVTNDGTALNDYKLRITAKPATWSVKEDAGSTVWNEFRLLGLFTSSDPPGPTDFVETAAEDIVKASTDTTATTDIYAINAEGAEVKGYGCTQNAVRKLWFKFDAPSGTDLITQQWITVTVYAIQG